jgi:hypothetical protein
MEDPQEVPSSGADWLGRDPLVIDPDTDGLWDRVDLDRLAVKAVLQTSQALRLHRTTGRDRPYPGITGHHGTR